MTPLDSESELLGLGRRRRRPHRGRHARPPPTAPAGPRSWAVLRFAWTTALRAGRPRTGLTDET